MLRALKEGSKKNLRQCLDMEFGIVTQFMKPNTDFYEGIRAQLVEKGLLFFIKYFAFFHATKIVNRSKSQMESSKIG